MKRFLGVLLVLVLLLGGVAVVGAFVLDDRIRTTASDRVAGELQRSVPFSTSPRVTIEGYPFAWHLVTREFPSVRVEARAMPVQADETTTITLYDVDVTLSQVRIRPDAVHAATLTGGGWLDYADLSRVSGARIGRADEQRVFFARDVEVLGAQVTGRLVGRPVLDREAQTLSLADAELELAGMPIPAGATQAMVDAILRPVAVELPQGLKLSALEPADHGLVVTVDATDVTFPLG